MFGGFLCICRAAPCQGGILFLSPSLHLCLVFWLTSRCSSKPSLCPWCRVMCIYLSKPAVVHTLAPLFHSWGMCSPKCGAGREQSCWIGIQRVLQQGYQGYQQVKTRIKNVSHAAVPTAVCGAMLRLENEETFKTSSFRISALLAYFSILCVTLSNMTWLKLVLDSVFGNRKVLVRII